MTGTWVSTQVHGGPTGLETSQYEKCMVPPCTYVHIFYIYTAKVVVSSLVALQQQDLHHSNGKLPPVIVMPTLAHTMVDRLQKSLLTQWSSQWDKMTSHACYTHNCILLGYQSERKKQATSGYSAFCLVWPKQYSNQKGMMSNVGSLLSLHCPWSCMKR